MPDQAGNKDLIRSERTPQGNYDLYGGSDAAELFVEGLSDVMLGPFVTKLTFHVTERLELLPNTGEALEIRQVRLRLAMPTSTVLEMMSFVSASLNANSEALIAKAEAIVHQMHSMRNQDNK